MNTLSKTLCILSSLASLSTTTTHAALLAYEGFDYTVGEQLTAQNGGSGFDTVGFSFWYNASGTVDRPIETSSLSYPASVTFTPTGNKVALITDGSEFFGQTGRNLDATATLGAATVGTRYISFLASSTQLSAYNQFGLGQDGGTNAVTFGFDSGQFALEGTGASKVTFGSGVLTSTTYMFVGKVSNDGVNSIASLSVYAAGDSVPGTEGTWQATTGAFTSLNLNRVFGFQGPNSDFKLDEIRIGDTYDSVVAVPEPSTWAMLLGGLGVVAFLRRRKANRA